MRTLLCSFFAFPACSDGDDEKPQEVVIQRLVGGLGVAIEQLTCRCIRNGKFAPVDAERFGVTSLNAKALSPTTVLRH